MKKKKKYPKKKKKLLMLFEMNAEKGNYKDVKVYMI